jgi:hypothetical protein
MKQQTYITLGKGSGTKECQRNGSRKQRKYGEVSLVHTGNAEKEERSNMRGAKG